MDKMNASELNGPVLKQPDDDTINLVEIFFLLLRHWVVILLCALLGGIISFGYTYWCLPAMYSATSKIYIVSSSSNSIINMNDLQLGTTLAPDYQALMEARPLLEDVINELNLDMTPAALKSSLSITNPTGHILNITATTTQPKLSAEIVNGMAEQAMKYFPKVMDIQAPSVIETALVPTSKSSPSFLKNTLMGLGIGFILSCAYYVVRFLLDDTISAPEQMANYFGAEPLGVIPVANYKGRRRRRSYGKAQKVAKTSKNSSSPDLKVNPVTTKEQKI